MEITREPVEQWLEANHRDREWLAEKCGVGVRAVGNWLNRKNPRPIPAAQILIIRKLMEEDAAASQAAEKVPHNLVLEFDDESYSAIEEAALKAEESIRQWASVTLQNAADCDMEALAERILGGKEPINITTLPKKRAHLMAAAGPGIMAEVIDWDGEGDIVSVKICGDSMAPLFDDGQIIDMTHKRASRSPYMAKGLIYLVELEGEWMVKRYGTRNARPDEKDAEYLTGTKRVGILKSENPDFADIDITGPFEWAAWYDDANH